jgi:hypothetical protein
LFLRLALGIGSCVTIFSVVDTQLINSYTPAAERPIWFRMVRESGSVTMGASAADFVDWRKSAISFEVLVAQRAHDRDMSAALVHSPDARFARQPLSQRARATAPGVTLAQAQARST